VKSIPDWNDVYFIGDAAGTIPPASGSGLNIAISSGCMAAEYAIKNQAPLFRKAWKKRYTQQFQAAQILHELMMRPKLAHFVMGVSEYLPTVPLYLFQMTRTRID
jgi:flavin-dependent dehydrogenase